MGTPSIKDQHINCIWIFFFSNCHFFLFFSFTLWKNLQIILLQKDNKVVPCFFLISSSFLLSNILLMKYLQLPFNTLNNLYWTNETHILNVLQTFNLKLCPHSRFNNLNFDTNLLRKIKMNNNNRDKKIKEWR